MESNVKVEAGLVVIPKVPPIPDVLLIQRFANGNWHTENYHNIVWIEDYCKKRNQPYRIVRIPGEEVKHGE
jgi:hypothetical protein